MGGREEITKLPIDYFVLSRWRKPKRGRKWSFRYGVRERLPDVVNKGVLRLRIRLTNYTPH